MNTSIVEVAFRVYAETLPGEEIRVSGNVPALGCNNPDRAIPLLTTPSENPWWRSAEAIYLPGGPIRYRYCLFSGGKFSRWEGNGNFERKLKKTQSDDFRTTTKDKFDVPSVKFNKNPVGNDNLQTVTTASESRSFKSKQFAEFTKKSGSDHNFKPTDGVLVVAYFLPVILNRSRSGQWTVQWDKENILSLQIDGRMIWVGTVRYNNQPIPPEEEAAVAHALLDFNCFPVFLSQSTHFQFYDIFCKKNLWLIMHHIADVYGPLNQNDIGAKSQQNLWFVYSTVHKMFRDKVLEVYQQDYLIWIHGFHLMLLPAYLRRRLTLTKIGYFFHTPFPSSELWRTMSQREELIRGILGADQIGFHLYEYARHFMTTCHRVLGYSSGMSASGVMTVNVDGREVRITCTHVGVDMPRIDEILMHDLFEEHMKHWKGRFPNKIVVVGIDRLERLKGIPLKLMAISQFLDENPQWRGKLVFALCGVTAGERGRDYKQTLHDVKILVNSLNAEYAGSDPNDKLVYFEERHEKDIRLLHRLSFFAAADILLITATRDGLNRYPMEFTLAKKRIGELSANPDSFLNSCLRDRLPGAGLPGQGIVIISEFVSSARVMRGALTVNPWRTDEVIGALKHALEMKDSERAERMRRNLEFSMRLTTQNWAYHILSDLKSVEKSRDIRQTYAVGFGMQFKVMDLKAGSRALNTQDVCNAYKTATNRLILLDWGGTLEESMKGNKLQSYLITQGHALRDGPSVELKQTLEALCSDPKNTIFVVSGKELHALTAGFDHFKGLGLAAEHGFYYRWPRNDVGIGIAPDTGKPKWQSIMPLMDESWKESARKIMDIFVQRTHGTYIEEKGTALIWQYTDADPEFGFMQSKELEDHLKDLMNPYNVDVLRGGNVADGYIEVRPAGLSKGLFLEHVVSMLKQMHKDPGFIMTIGDDDEPMFERLNEIKKQHENTVKNRRFSSNRHGGGNVLSAFSVAVGRKPTAAFAYIDDVAAVIELLGILSRQSTIQKKKFQSSLDLSVHSKKNLAGFSSPLQSQAQGGLGMSGLGGGLGMSNSATASSGAGAGAFVGSLSSHVSATSNGSGGGGSSTNIAKSLSTGNIMSMLAAREQSGGGGVGTLSAGATSKANSQSKDSDAEFDGGIDKHAGFSLTKSQSVSQYVMSTNEGDSQDDDIIFF